jgi:hypothetical protein
MLSILSKLAKQHWQDCGSISKQNHWFVTAASLSRHHAAAMVGMGLFAVWPMLNRWALGHSAGSCSLVVTYRHGFLGSTTEASSMFARLFTAR